MSFQAYLDHMEAKAGRTPEQFIAPAKERGHDEPAIKAGVIVDRLKADHGLGRGHATALVQVDADCKRSRLTGVSTTSRACGEALPWLLPSSRRSCGVTSSSVSL